MRGWLTWGVAATAIGGVAVVALARRRVQKETAPAALPASSSSSTVAASPPTDSLPTALNDSLTRWLVDLASKSPPPPEMVSAALLFADQLANAGFPAAATNLRTTVNQIVSADETQQAEAEPELERTELWVNHYLGGWTTTESNVQMIVRDALDHLAAEADGYVRKRPSEWDELQAGENANELAALGQPTLASGLRDLIAAAAKLPSEEP